MIDNITLYYIICSTFYLHFYIFPRMSSVVAAPNGGSTWSSPPDPSDPRQLALHPPASCASLYFHSQSSHHISLPLTPSSLPYCHQISKELHDVVSEGSKGWCSRRHADLDFTKGGVWLLIKLTVLIFFLSLVHQ